MYRYALALLVSAAPLTANAQTAPAPAPAAAPAAAAATPAVGATVLDTKGGTVGTISAINGGNATIDTGTVQAAVPMTALGTSPKGPTLAMTKAELEAAAGQSAQAAQADFKSKLVVGAPIYGTGGAALGTVGAVDDQYVTLKTTAGKEAKVPVGSFGPGPQGVTIGMTAEQLEAAMGGK